MAIRDFGNSLLADVRKRSDEQRDDARRYARKESNRDVLRGLGAMVVSPIIGGAIQGVGKIFTSNLQNKTNKFLADTALQKNKIFTSFMATQVEEKTKAQDAAKSKDMSILQYYADKRADTSLIKLQIQDPSTYNETESAYHKASIIDSPEILELARGDAAYHDAVISKSNDFSAGRASSKTLESLATMQRTKGLGRRLIEKLKGTTTTVDMFNKAMGELPQVKIAQEIYGLSQKRLAAAQQIAVKTGSVAQGIMASGLPTDPKNLEEAKRMMAKGNVVSYEPTFDVEDGLRVRTVKITTDIRGNAVGPPEFSTQQLSTGGKPATNTELLSAITKNQSIHKNVRLLVGEQGYEDFLQVAGDKGFIKPNMTIPDYVALQNFSADYNNYTSQENYIQPLTEGEADIRAALIKINTPMLALLDNPKVSDDKKLQIQAQLMQSLTMSGAAAKLSSEKEIESTPRPKIARPIGLPPEAQWSTKNKGWFMKDPQNPGKYLKVQL